MDFEEFYKMKSSASGKSCVHFLKSLPTARFGLWKFEIARGYWTSSGRSRQEISLQIGFDILVSVWYSFSLRLLFPSVKSTWSISLVQSAVDLSRGHIAVRLSAKFVCPNGASTSTPCSGGLRKVVVLKFIRCIDPMCIEQPSTNSHRAKFLDPIRTFLG